MVLYEEDAKDTLSLYFRNLAYAMEDESSIGKAEAGISYQKSETENAISVINYFRSCGWISERELGRNGDHIASVSPHCMKMMDAIERIFNRDNSAVLTNHIFSIYDTLASAFTTDHGRTLRPYSSILVPVMDNMSDLKNELSVLKDSIRLIMGIVIKMTETNELGQFLVKDEVMEAFFNDYFFIKKDGLIPGYVEEIEKMLRKLVTTQVYDNMIKEYARRYGVDVMKAHQTIDEYLEGLKSFISYDYVKEMDYIDKKINRYYNLYSTRILMVLSNNVNMQNHLNKILMCMKNLDSDEKETFLTELSNSFTIQTHKYIGRKSLELRKKRSPNNKSGALVQSTLSEEEKAELTRKALYRYPDKYDVKQATSYFEKLIGRDRSVCVSPDIIHTKEDAMMIAASIMYSNSKEFPFEVEFLEGIIETEIAWISNVRIKRKTNE